MEIQIKHPQYNTSIQIKVDEKTTLYFNPTISGSNCKLMTLENAAGLFTTQITEDVRKQVLTELMKHFPLRNMLITLLSEQQINWLRDNFEHYYCCTVPVGYSGGNQYHILLKNNADSRQPVKYVEKDTKNTITKDKVLEIVNAAFLHSEKRNKRIEYIAREIEGIQVSL